jgi:glutamine synthetase
MAPIQAIWAKDNRGVMIRVLGDPGDPATHLENRVGEPLANPYLYMASQIHAGLDGVARKLIPAAASESPYGGNGEQAEGLPKNLEEALGALAENACFRSAFGAAFVDYYVAIKRFEVARAVKEAGVSTTEVTSWEHREYFDMA